MSDRNQISGEVKELLLVNLLESSKKHRIKSIAERYGIKLSEKNTKQQMIDAALPAIDVQFRVKLKHYSPEDLALAMKCFTEEEISDQFADEITHSTPFADGAIYIIGKKDRLFAAIPHELAGKLMMQCVTQCFDSSMDGLTRCAAACAALYGRFTPERLADVAQRGYSLDVTESQAEQYLVSADSDTFRFSDGLAVNSRMNSFEVQSEAQGLKYYLPTRAEIDSYSVYGADANDYYYRQTVNFIYNNVDLSYDKAHTLMRDIADWCRSYGSFPILLRQLEESGMKLSADKLNYLLGMISELSNRTRKPSLLGHKPEEVDGVKPTVFPGLRAETVKQQPVRAEQKVGRNDPCPCGSGKKYKKCCGRNK